MLERFTWWILICSLFLAVGSAGAQTPVLRTTLDTTVTMHSPGSVHLSVFAGHVNVTAGSGDQVRVRATGDLDGMRFSASRARVTVHSDLELPEKHRTHTRLDVTVPTGTRVVVEAVNAPVAIRGVRGEVNVETMRGAVSVSDAVRRVSASAFSGGVTLERIEGDVRVESVSGPVRLRDVSGDIDIEAVSGAIDIANATSRRVKAETVSGAVTYRGSIDPGGQYRLITHSGAVRVAMPAGAGATFRVETYAGGIDTEFPVTLEPRDLRKKEESRYEFTVGDGRARVVAETFTGSVKIERARASR